jgi:hypothetical protein
MLAGDTIKGGLPRAAAAGLGGESAAQRALPRVPRRAAVGAADAGGGLTVLTPATVAPRGVAAA